MPCYRQVAEAAVRGGTRIVAVTAENPERNRAYLTSNGVRVDTVVPIGMNTMRLAATPTLVLVQSDGRVINSWRGRLAGDAEHEVLSAVNGP